jgi:MFS family permease
MRMSLLPPAYAGFIYFCTFAGSAMFTLYAGSLLDRTDRFRIMLAFQPVYVITLAALAMLNLLRTGQEILMVLPILTFVNGISLAFLFPGRFALLSIILDDRQLALGTTTLNILILATFGIAPIAYGVLRSYMTWPVLFTSLAIIYAIGGTMLGGLKLSQPLLTRTTLQSMPDTGLRSVRAAFRANPMLGVLLLLNPCGQFVFGAIIVLLPQFAQGVLDLGEIPRGLAMSSAGAGLVAGGVVARRMSSARNRGSLLLGSLAALGAILMCFPMISHLSVFVAMLFCLGLTSGFRETTVGALIQVLSPNAVRGRILGLYSLACLMAPALSGLLCGVIADAAGVKTALFACGLFIFSAAPIFAIRSPALRSYRGN